MVEDIHQVLMEYRVRMSNTHPQLHLTFVLDLIAARHLRRELSTHRESHTLVRLLLSRTNRWIGTSRP